METNVTPIIEAPATTPGRSKIVGLFDHQCVAEFDNGECYLFFDARATESANESLVDAVVSDGKRRLKAGDSDVISIRVRTAADRLNLEESPLAAAA